MPKNIVQHVVVGAAVLNKQKEVLIIQRSADEDSFPNLWELPSGHKEALETAEDAVKREVKEESGLEIKLAKPFAVFNYQVEKPMEIRDVTQINFLAEVIGNLPVNLDRDHQSFAWIKLKDLDKYSLSQKTRKVIEEAIG